MLDEAALLQTLRRHWEYPEEDEDSAHEIYHDDAVLEFPSPANGSKVCRTSGDGAGSTPRSWCSSCAASPIAMTWS